MMPTHNLKKRWLCVKKKAKQKTHQSMTNVWRFFFFLFFSFSPPFYDTAFGYSNPKTNRKPQLTLAEVMCEWGNIHESVANAHVYSSFPIRLFEKKRNRKRERWWSGTMENRTMNRFTMNKNLINFHWNPTQISIFEKNFQIKEN